MCGLLERLGGELASGDAGPSRRPRPVGASRPRTDPWTPTPPWSPSGPGPTSLTERLGYRLPLAVKRGYHMHYMPEGNAFLNHPTLDADRGYFLAPMATGIRLTTGAEFANRDAPKTPVQLARAEPVARELFPLGERVDPEPWMGYRPCTPDMMPIIGPAPKHKNLWFGFGHAHHGLTLGPVTGRLLAEMITGRRDRGGSYGRTGRTGLKRFCGRLRTKRLVRPEILGSRWTRASGSPAVAQPAAGRSHEDEPFTEPEGASKAFRLRSAALRLKPLQSLQHLQALRLDLPVSTLRVRDVVAHDRRGVTLLASCMWKTC